MTLYEFKGLSEDQQTELVWSEVDFVADRQEDNYCICFISYTLFMWK